MERLSFQHRRRPPGHNAIAAIHGGKVDLVVKDSRMLRILVGLVGAALMCICAAAADGGLRNASAYPGSMVVLGNDGAALGQGADSAHPYRSTPGDSFATGTNPAVKSIYSRILAVNPAIRGHAVNLVSEDASATALQTQFNKAAALKPGLVVIDLEGDVQCDGKDQARVAAFGTQVTAALAALESSLPSTKIVVMSSWGSFSSYVKYLNGLSKDARLKHAGKSLCQFVSAPSGNVLPSHVAYVEKFVYAYDKQLATACAASSQCHYDGGAAQRMPTTAVDISLDQDHLSVQGEAKLAATEWTASSGFIAGG